MYHSFKTHWVKNPHLSSCYMGITTLLEGWDHSSPVRPQGLRMCGGYLLTHEYLQYTGWSAGPPVWAGFAHHTKCWEPTQSLIAFGKVSKTC